MTTQIVQPSALETSGEIREASTSTSRRLGSLRATRPLSPVPVYAGIAVAAAGILLIGLAWSGVAGEADVSRQVPYLVSGGIFGLALVLVGMTTINVASKRRETALREQQTRLLANAVEELGRVLDDVQRR